MSAAPASGTLLGDTMVSAMYTGFERNAMAAKITPNTTTLLAVHVLRSRRALASASQVMSDRLSSRFKSCHRRLCRGCERRCLADLPIALRRVLTDVQSVTNSNQN